MKNTTKTINQLIAGQPYSYLELTEKGFVLGRFSHTCSVFLDDAQKKYFFRHHAPPVDQPHHRFYYVTQLKKNSDMIIKHCKIVKRLDEIVKQLSDEFKKNPNSVMLELISEEKKIYDFTHNQHHKDSSYYYLAIGKIKKKYGEETRNGNKEKNNMF